ncbi:MULTISPECIES: SUKH-3 domain-containing protein [unclassified Streptomyces]|uniref:SUKH-3 domain-containing protein n=1 Tax=unclassified Streptomyces TaxID=2593676 RepID=UPI0036F15149
MIRFDSLRPDLLRALRDAGWHPRRRVGVSPWLDSLQQEGYLPNQQAEEILAALGGLVIEPINQSGSNFSNDEPFNFDPISAGSGQRGLATEIEGVLGGQYFPIGEWLSYSSVFIEAEGKVVAAGLGWIWEMGSTFEDALELAICADRPLVCLYSDPGLEPWPH